MTQWPRKNSHYKRGTRKISLKCMRAWTFKFAKEILCESSCVCINSLSLFKKLYKPYLWSPSFGRVLANAPVNPTPRTGEPIQVKAKLKTRWACLSKQLNLKFPVNTIRTLPRIKACNYDQLRTAIRQLNFGAG